MGIHPRVFHVSHIPALTIESGIKVGIVGLGCAVVSILFCLALKGVASGYKKWLKNPYIRVVAASALIIGIMLLLHTTDYMGASTGLIEKAIEEGEARPLDFLWKLILTAITMKAGFKGGEIVPSFCIGATFGCVARYASRNGALHLCSSRNGGCFLRCDQLSADLDPHCL